MLTVPGVFLPLLLCVQGRSGAEATVGGEPASCEALFIPQGLLCALDDTPAALGVSQAKDDEHVTVRAQPHTCPVWPSTGPHAAAAVCPRSHVPGKPHQCLCAFSLLPVTCV